MNTDENKTAEKINKKKNLTLNFDDDGNEISNNRTGINQIPDEEMK